MCVYNEERRERDEVLKKTSGQRRNKHREIFVCARGLGTVVLL